MSYTRQNFEDGTILTASHLNNIEMGIISSDIASAKALLNSNPFSFKGKKLLVTGDSITERNFRSSVLWHDYLKDWYGLASVQNDGLSGSGLVKNNGIVYRLNNWSKYGNPDIILIMGNMNDGTSSLAGQPATGNPEWFGKFEDQSEDMKDQSLYGALHYTLNTIINKYPNIPVGWIISQPRSQVGSQGKCWGVDSWFEKWVDAIKEVCNHYSVPVLDLYHESGLRPWIAEHNKKFFSCSASPDGDGIHPNALGQEIMAKKIYFWMNQHMLPIFTDVSEGTEYVDVTGVTFNNTPSIIVGESVTWSVSVLPNNATNPTVKWSCSNNNVKLEPAIEAFGQKCVITGLSTGTCNIIIETEDGGKTRTKTINVLEEGSVGDDENTEENNYFLIDTFDRPDSDILGESDTGQLWLTQQTASSNTISIKNQKAVSNNSGYPSALCSVNTSKNIYCEADVNYNGSGQILLYTNYNYNTDKDYICVRLNSEGVSLIKKVSGANSVINTTTCPDGEFNLAISQNDTEYTVYINGTIVLTDIINDDNLNSLTYIGFSINGSDNYVDNFKVKYV
jgi:lysophospholipase L1-like esterase